MRLVRRRIVFATGARCVGEPAPSVCATRLLILALALSKGTTKTPVRSVFNPLGNSLLTLLLNKTVAHLETPGNKASKQCSTVWRTSSRRPCPLFRANQRNTKSASLRDGKALSLGTILVQKLNYLLVAGRNERGRQTNQSI